MRVLPYLIRGSLCVSGVSCCGLPFEYELALEEAGPSPVEADRRNLQAGLHLAAGAIAALPHRTGMGATSVTDLSPYVGPFGCNFRATWCSFPVVILVLILVVKTTTENRSFNRNLLQKPNLRRQNDDRKTDQNRDRKIGHWIPKSASKLFRNRAPRRSKYGHDAFSFKLNC